MYLLQIRPYRRLIFLCVIISICSCNNHTAKIEEQANFIIELRSSSPKKALKAVDSLLELGNKSSRTALLFEKAITYGALDQPEQAMLTYEEALPLLEQEENKKYLGRAYYNLAVLNEDIQKKERAVELQLLALKKGKETDDKKLQSAVYIHLAAIYISYKDYEKAQGYLEQAGKIQEQLKDTSFMSAVYNNIAITYKNTGNYKRALAFNKKALHLNKIMKDTPRISKSYNNLGQVYLKLNNNTEAVKYYLQSISLNRKQGVANSSALRNLAHYHLKNKRYKQAKLYFEEEEQMKKTRTDIESINELYVGLREIAVVQKDFEKVLYYQKLCDSLADEQAAIDKADNLEYVENQFKFMVAKTKLEQQKSINNKNRVILLSCFGIMALLTILHFQRSRNKELKHQQERILLERSILRSQMNPHFIFNSLSAIQNSLLDNSPIQSASYLSRFAKLIRLNFDFINHESISLVDELDALKNYIETQQMRFKQKFDYEITISDDLDQNTISIPPLLLQPFVENSIEHGFKNLRSKGYLEIKITPSDDLVMYEISDNGHGIKPDYKQNYKLHAIDIFKKRIKLMGEGLENKVEITSSEEGTTIKFVLPL